MTAERRSGRRPKRTRCQESEDRVLGKMRDLSRDKVDDGKSFRARVGKQPEHEWSNDPGCV